MMWKLAHAQTEPSPALPSINTESLLTSVKGVPFFLFNPSCTAKHFPGTPDHTLPQPIHVMFGCWVRVKFWYPKIEWFTANSELTRVDRES